MKVDNWIKVGDDLPEIGEYVLGYGAESTLGGLHYEQVKRNDSGCWCSVVNYTHVRITHWMPLPSPPAIQHCCSECGGITIIDYSVSYTSMPTKYKGICKECGNVDYFTT